MIPHTFPSEFVTPNGKTQAIVYSLPSVSGLTAWIDYIPVKGIANSNTAVENTYAADGYVLVRNLDAISGMTPFKDYIPVYEDNSATKPWSTDVGGYIPMYGLFSVQGLFANGEQGAWYQPSDLTTLFQDSAGTTPVTAVEQPVGLMLDKSKGLAVSNTDSLLGKGTFSNAADWTDVNGVSTISNSTVTFNGSATLGGKFCSVTGLTVGKYYEVTFTINSISSGGIRVWAGTTDPGASFTKTTAGTHTYRILCTGDSYVRVYNNATATTAVVSNVTIKEVQGNHAYQATSANRPVLSARVNLLTKTEQFDDAAWTKTAVTVAATGYADPSGGSAARLMLETTATSAHNVGQTPTVSGTYKWLGRIKAGGRTYAAIGNNADGAVIINLSNGLTTAVTGNTSLQTPSNVEVTALSDGWYGLSFTSVATTTFLIYTMLDSVWANRSFAGDASKGIYIWGADLRVSNDGVGIPTYQRVNTSTDYDTVGFPLYLKFDGVDDSLATNSINFSATDKMTVWAGVRKLSDAAQANIVELSANATSNSGTFYLSDPNGAGTDVNFYVRGTSFTQAYFTDSAAPLTKVFTGSADISAPSNTLRANGVQKAITSATLGSGNFGNYPLYIGRRGGVSFPFNGRLYSLIVRGAQSSASQISQGESWMNGQTKAY